MSRIFKMNTVNTVNKMNGDYRYTLDRSSRKFNCPGCGKRRFVRVVDNETKDYLPENVGRCDRENGCGYEFKWSDYLKGQNINPKPFYNTEPVEEKPVDFLPINYLAAVVPEKFYPKNNFFLFLVKRYGDLVARDVFKKYCLGTSSYWKGSTLFPQIDNEGNLRQVKIMLYDPFSGKRIKEGAEVERFDRISKTYTREVTQQPCSIIYGRFLSDDTRALNLEQTFFGAHLLAEYPEKEVCVVESEKTALIASIHLPDFVWLATGGASGCKWREYKTYKIFQGRSVTFFPDYGTFNVKTGKTCFLEWSERVERIKEVLPCKIKVSSVLEKYFDGIERQDQDLADLYLEKVDDTTGLVLTEFNYPATFDYKI